MHCEVARYSSEPKCIDLCGPNLVGNCPVFIDKGATPQRSEFPMLKKLGSVKDPENCQASSHPDYSMMCCCSSV